MILAHTISVEGKSRQQAEKLMGEAFNDWAKSNPDCSVFHLFEPFRHNEIYGDYNYNKYHSEFTFFYMVIDDITRNSSSHEPTTGTNAPKLDRGGANSVEKTALRQVK